MQYLQNRFTLPAGPGTVTDIEWSIAMGRPITEEEAQEQYRREYSENEDFIGPLLTFSGWLQYRQIKLKEDTQ